MASNLPHMCSTSSIVFKTPCLYLCGLRDRAGAGKQDTPRARERNGNGKSVLYNICHIFAICNADDTDYLSDMCHRVPERYMSVSTICGTHL